MTIKEQISDPMSVLTKLLRDSYDLEESEGDASAYWHLQKLRAAIKAEQIKSESITPTP